MKEKVRFTLVFGALCSPIEKQIVDQGLDPSNLDCIELQKDSDAITRLREFVPAS